MTAIASHITSLTIAYSIVYSDTDQRKHQSSASLAFVRGNHRDRWSPRTNGKLRWKCFHLMTSSWCAVKHIQGIMHAARTLMCFWWCGSGEHYDDVTWTSCSFKLPVIRLIVDQFMQTHIKKSMSALLALCEGNSSVTGEFPAQRLGIEKKSFNLMTSSYISYIS